MRTPGLDPVKLSVRVITYNHAPFIRQALDSVLAQRADFPYEIVIGEDCSTDGTREIVVEYQRRHPERIRLILSDRNLGGRHNFVRTLQACRGEYIALLDGDDYWTSEDKLQRQVDFLERHPGYVICFHDALVVHEDRSRPPERFTGPDLPSTPSFQSLLDDCFLPTCGVVIRDSIRQFPDWFWLGAVGDWPLHILNARRGRVGYLNEVMGVYRIHKGGMTRNFVPEDYFTRSATMLHHLVGALGDRYEPVLRNSASQIWLNAFFHEDGLEALRKGEGASLGDALRRWPAEFPLTRRDRGALLGAACGRLMLASLRAGDRTRAGVWLMRAVRHDPRWLRRGAFWSVAAETCLGRTVAANTRRCARWLGAGTAKSEGVR